MTSVFKDDKIRLYDDEDECFVVATVGAIVGDKIAAVVWQNLSGLYVGAAIPLERFQPVDDATAAFQLTILDGYEIS